MARIDLQDLLSLYKKPAANENPGVERLSTLRTIIKKAGRRFPVITTRAVLTHILKPEKDGDFHFYGETERGSDEPDTPMMTCEIQGMSKKATPSAKHRGNELKLLAGEDVEITGLLRAWPEHLRDSTEPHLFEIHPVVEMRAVHGKVIDFHDRVIWPTGEDEGEATRTFSRAFDKPGPVKLVEQGGRLVFRHPKKNFKKENYVHVEGVASRLRKHLMGSMFTLTSGSRSVECFVLDASPVSKKVSTLKDGKRYRVGGLCGLDLPSLAATRAEWKAVFSPVLEIEPA